jgi:hypothetical protein
MKKDKQQDFLAYKKAGNIKSPAFLYLVINLIW